MSREITRTIYSFSELSDKAQAKVIDNARQAEAEFFDASDTLEDARTVAGLMGFVLGKDAISYSGFSCQGDGASFVGTWYPSDVKIGATVEYAPKDAELARLAGIFEGFARLLAGANDAGVAVERRSHRYAHEHTVGFEFGDDFPEVAQTDFAEAGRDLMRWVYRQLEAEWEYRLSDETIREQLTEDDKPRYREDGRLDS